MNPDESGFTTREEFEMINAIEDTIIENISSKHNIVFAGAIKTDGRLDLYIYTQSIKGIDDIINSTMQTKFGDYQYFFDIKEDEEWKNYHSFLYPNPYEFQGIKNREVTFQLEQNGDNPEVKRMVDHWIDFKDKSNLKSFIDSAVAKGFEVLSEQQNDHEEFKYSLNIAKQNAHSCSRGCGNPQFLRPIVPLSPIVESVPRAVPSVALPHPPVHALGVVLQVRVVLIKLLLLHPSQTFILFCVEMLDQEVLASDNRLGLASLKLDKLVRIFIFDYSSIFRKASFGFVFNFTRLSIIHNVFDNNQTPSVTT
jgi:hypothetical protein